MILNSKISISSAQSKMFSSKVPAPGRTESATTWTSTLFATSLKKLLKGLSGRGGGGGGGREG